MADDQSLAGLRALVIEDEYFIAEDLKRVLRRHGADTVKLSGSMDDAVKQIEADGFEIALLDLNLHGDMAYKLADKFMRERISFGFVSGYERTSIPARFASVPLLTKPCAEAEIVTYVRTLRARPASIA